MTDEQGHDNYEKNERYALGSISDEFVNRLGYTTRKHVYPSIDECWLLESLQASHRRAFAVLVRSPLFLSRTVDLAGVICQATVHKGRTEGLSENANRILSSNSVRKSRRGSKIARGMIPKYFEVPT